MVHEGYLLELIEWSQAYSLLAFAVSVRGPRRGFPALLGVSVRSRRRGVVDLLPQEAGRPGTLVCLIERPEELGDSDDASGLHYSGEITFALWRDNTFQSELARIPWREWGYSNLESLNPYSRIAPCAAAYIEHDFTAMRERYAGQPFWTAHRLDNR
jgi:hypothetical protein